MKKTIFGLATCGLLLSSCSSNDVFEDNQGTNNPNVINFSATTTRATINNLDNVKGGFPVYAVTTKDAQGKDDLAWQINGAVYQYITGSWVWNGNAQKWPELAKFPMNFYAYYPATKKDGSNATYAPVKGTNVNELTATITIGSTAADQEDYLAANNTGIVRPQTTVPLRFNHITTKINFGVIAAEGTKSYIQQMNINNVKNTGTYDYVTKNDWTIAQNATAEAKYDYYKTTTAGSLKPVVVFTNNLNNAATPFYPCTPEGQSQLTAEDKHLMLLPQSGTKVWTPAIFAGTETPQNTEDQTYETPTSPAGKTITPLKAYIGSVYRMTSADGNTDLVGYTNASNHPNYKGSAAATATPAYNGPLFVKVGFPLNTGFFWTMGKAYTYNISLGGLYSTGGYLLDNRYYDENGRPTDLLIGGTDPGEPVSGGTINFDVTVGEWDEQTATPIQ